MKSKLVILFILVGSFYVSGQTTAPKYSNEFLHNGLDARGLSLGGAHVSLTGDVNSFYWNPSGVLNIQEDLQATITHSEQLASLSRYTHIGFAKKIDSISVFGISAIRFCTDNLPDTRGFITSNGTTQSGPSATFATKNYGVFLTYGRQIKNFQTGANLKIVYRKIGDFANAWGIGFDVGMQKVIKNWKLGFVLKDGTGTYNTWFINSDALDEVFAQTDNQVPSNSLEISLPRLVSGVHRTFKLNDSTLYCTGALDFETTFDGKRNTLLGTSLFSINPHAGIELNYENKYYLRYGVTNFRKETINADEQKLRLQNNIGIGLKKGRFAIDYAFLNFNRLAEELYSHVFSLKMSIN